MDQYKLYSGGDDKEREGNIKLLILQIIASFTNRFKWFVLYFFILEAEKIRIKMTSETPLERN